MQPDDFAALVVTTVNAALGPIRERMAAMEAKFALFHAFEATVGDLRDRVLAGEAKAAVLVPDAAGPIVAAAITPVVERLSGLEAKFSALPNTEKTLTELREQFITFEAKANAPAVPDPAIGDLRERVAVIEHKSAQPQTVALESKSDPHVTEILTQYRDRLVALETKAQAPSTTEIALSEVRQRFDTELPPLKATIAELTKEIGGLRERVAVAEVRPGLPGPAGKDGKDGVDGLGLEDLSADFDGDRTLSLKLERGHLKKAIPIVLPYLRYQGVFLEGKSYSTGDVVTWAGSTWHAQETTTSKPGEGISAWRLMVKRGRDGKDGRDAVAMPVVSLGGTK